MAQPGVIEYALSRMGYAKRELMMAVQQKVSAAGQVISFLKTGRPLWFGRNYASYAKEGYEKNIVAYRCISLVAKSAASIPLIILQGEEPIKDQTKHPLGMLLRRPNPWQGGAQFVESHLAYEQIHGNAYMEMMTPGLERTAPTAQNLPLQLYTHRPDRVSITPSNYGTPEAFVYKNLNQEFVWQADPMTGLCSLIHFKRFHPTDDWYGFSPIQAAAMGIDSHNSILSWNKALLDNSAQPSGALVYKPEGMPGASLTEDQYNILNDRLINHYSGKGNQGRPMLLDGGLDWVQMSLSPKDMDWLNAKNTIARDICQAFGVPPYLYGIEGDNTYSNMQEARQMFYEDTVLPTLDTFLDTLNNVLAPLYGDGIRIGYDPRKITALAAKYEAQWTSVGSAFHLSINEKRQLTGLPKSDLPEADMIFIPSTWVPLEGSTAPPQELDANGDPIDPEDAADGGADEADEPDDGDEPAKPKPGSKPGKKPPKGKARGSVRREAMNLILKKEGYDAEDRKSMLKLAYGR